MYRQCYLHKAQGNESANASQETAFVGPWRGVLGRSEVLGSEPRREVEGGGRFGASSFKVVGEAEGLEEEGTQ